MKGSLIFFSENNIVIVIPYHMRLKGNNSFSNILPKSYAPVDTILDTHLVVQVTVGLILPNVSQLNNEGLQCFSLLKQCLHYFSSIHSLCDSNDKDMIFCYSSTPTSSLCFKTSTIALYQITPKLSG